ncbi:YadA-like family protein, partial [Dyella sp. ASV21]|uniref:YadA family autotransporter adhesin n=1 Tax=Dyella sp. ASV21 TaxID=2795114 RepID=UPI0018EC162F
PGANLTVGAGTDGEAVDFADKDGNARTLKNVMAGVDDADAVNVSQLKNAGLIDGNGNALAAVTYDQNADGSPNLGSVTLAKGGAPVSLKNVANGTDDNDAVNVSQLKAAGLVDIGGNMLDAVVYDPGMNRGQVTLGGFGSTTPVVLTNVADGKNPYDAVNFGQLSGLVTQINSVDARVTVLEGNVIVPDPIIPNPGSGKEISYLTATEGSSINNAANSGDTAGVALGYNSVASGDNASAMGHNAQALGTYGLATGNDAYAASTGDTAIGGNAQALAGSSTAVGSNSSVNASSGTAVGQGASVEAAATNAVALGTGSVATQANSVSVGAAGAERTVTNVAAGVNATDAVNMSQLNAMSDWSKNYTDQAFSVLSRSIDKTQRRASAGTASAIAMANMPQAYQPNMNTVSAGVGTYNGQNAISVGMTGISENGRWILRAGLTANSQGDKGAGMGAAYAW